MVVDIPGLWMMCVRKRWFCLLLFGLVYAHCQGPPSTSVPARSGLTTVRDGKELYQAINNLSVTFIELDGDMAMDPEIWNSPIALDRTLDITARRPVLWTVPSSSQGLIICSSPLCRLTLSGPFTLYQNLTVSSNASSPIGIIPTFIGYPPMAAGRVSLATFSVVIDKVDAFFDIRSPQYEPRNEWWSKDVYLLCEGPEGAGRLHLREWLISSLLWQRLSNHPSGGTDTQGYLIMRNITLELAPPQELATVDIALLCSKLNHRDQVFQRMMEGSSTPQGRTHRVPWWVIVLVVVPCCMLMALAFVWWWRKRARGRSQGPPALQDAKDVEEGPLSEPPPKRGARWVQEWIHRQQFADPAQEDQSALHEVLKGDLTKLPGVDPAHAATLRDPSCPSDTPSDLFPKDDLRCSHPSCDRYGVLPNWSEFNSRTSVDTALLFQESGFAGPSQREDWKEGVGSITESLVSGKGLEGGAGTPKREASFRASPGGEQHTDPSPMVPRVASTIVREAGGSLRDVSPPETSHCPLTGQRSEQQAWGSSVHQQPSMLKSEGLVPGSQASFHSDSKAVATSPLTLSSIEAGGDACTGEGRVARRQAALMCVTPNPFDCEVLANIGCGGYGTVYKVLWQGRTVALKVLIHRVEHRGALAKARALGEAILGSQLRHPNIVSTLNYSVVDPQEIYDLCSLGTGASLGAEDRVAETYILMEYCDRGTLRSLVRGGSWDPCKEDYHTAVGILLDVACAVQYLHHNGIVHGDLKGSNVLLTSSSDITRGFEVKVADFGISRILQNVGSTHTTLSRPMGTLSHMPPELIRHKRLSKAGDMYALGMLLYEVFTRQTPFQLQNYAYVVYTITMGDVSTALEFPPECPCEVVRLARRCWSKVASQRPDADELIQALLSLSPVAAESYLAKWAEYDKCVSCSVNACLTLSSMLMEGEDDRPEEDVPETS